MKGLILARTTGEKLKSGLRSSRCGGLTGQVTAPGDKSISHRSLILGALATGDTKIKGLLEGEDVLRTAAAMRAMGAEIEREYGDWRVRGGPWRAPGASLYFGNSGTGARLVMGAVAGAGLSATFDGDISLRGRPMGRILEPLRLMGLEATSNNGKMPVTIAGGTTLDSIKVKLATPSAQVKSAILLAALGAKGVTRIHEPVLSRDHTERMLAGFGIDLGFENDGNSGRYISIEGGQKLRACEIDVAGDPSSAAFIGTAAVISPGSDVTIKNVLMNPTRIGFYKTLREMGAQMSFENARVSCGEDVADIRFHSSVLHGVSVAADRAPSMIDEYPILAVAASFAHGETVLHGLEELRIKESDRIASIEAGLVACGVDVETGPDWIRITGDGNIPNGGGQVRTNHDHRIAMSFLVMGCASQKPVEVDNASMIATSYPEFVETMNAIGGVIDWAG